MFAFKYWFTLLLMGLSASGFGSQDPAQEFHEYAIRDHGGRLTIDETLTDYLSDLGAKVVREIDADRPYTFVLINDLEPDTWSLPGGLVAVSRGMFSLLRNEAELIMLLAHELQYANLIYDVAVGGLGASHKGIQIRAPNVTTLAMENVISVLGTVRGQSNDRVADLTADRLAQNAMAKVGYDPAAAVALSARLLDEEADARYFARHQPTNERVIRLQENVDRIVYRLNIQGGISGQESFSQAVSKLNETEEAYRLAEVAKERVSWNAIALIDKAIDALPVEVFEAAFHSQKAALLAELGQCDKALVELDLTLRRAPERYQDHLTKARCLQRLGRQTEALESYRESYRLLPNEASAFAIASLSKMRVDRETAKRFYMKLVVLKGRFHEHASREFARLDIEDNPRNYFISRSTVREGKFISTVSNLSGMDLARVKVRLVITVDGRQLVKHIRAGPLITDSEIELDPDWKVTTVENISAVSVGVVKVWLE